MANAESWTIGRLIQWTTEFLKSKGSEEARLEADLLLAHALKCPRIQLYTRFEEVVDEAHRSAYRELVKQRAAGIPVAYLLGTREFYSLEFEVTPDVLIPRPETEHLVIEALDRFKTLPADQPRRVLDIGTGSGIIAICLAKHAKNCQCVATDIGSAAIEVAKRNAARHQVSESIEFLTGDLFNALDGPEEFDLIVSNPPYIAESEKNVMDSHVLNHEPHQALFAEEDGLAIIRRIVEASPEYLKPGGWLLIEFSPMIARRATELVADHGAFENVSCGKDFAKLDRYLVAQRRAS